MAAVGIPSVVGEQLGGGFSRGAAVPVNEFALITATPSWVLAVLISIGASAMTVTGFVLQKRALHDAANLGQKWPRVGDIVLSPGWIFGFLVTAIFPVVGDLLAYSLAPLSLTAPLSGISVVLNMVIAPRILNEQLQRFPDVPATALILLGCLLTTAFGDHDRSEPYGAEMLLQLAARPTFVCGSLLGAGCGCAVVARQNRLKLEIEKLAAEQPQNPHLPHVLLPASAAALCGAIANIGLKGVGELIRHQSPKLDVLLCLVVTAPAAAIQVNFINRGLLLYPQSVFISVYGALLVLTNTMYGALFYEEYVPLLASRLRLLFFISGCGLIMCGVGLFRLRQPAKTDSNHKDEEIGLLTMDSVVESEVSHNPNEADGRRRQRNSTIDEEDL